MWFYGIMYSIYCVVNIFTGCSCAFLLKTEGVKTKICWAMDGHIGNEYGIQKLVDS